MIFNMSSGGAALNFEVVGGITAPTNPKENTIWVDTDTEISSWVFSATEPESSEAGMVWISNGTASVVPFNALKKNEITLYPMYPRQYVNGAWEGKTAQIYQSGAWNALWDGVLYDSGDEYEPITGGWYGGNVAVSSSASPGTITKNDDRIVIPNRQSASTGAITTKAIDLTGFSTLNAIYSGQTVGLRISPSFPTSSATANVNGDSVGSEQTKLTLDISAIEGKYQCALSCRSAYTVYLYKMWLE